MPELTPAAPGSPDYKRSELSAKTTTELLHILETERLTARQTRMIKAELRTRVI